MFSVLILAAITVNSQDFKKAKINVKKLINTEFSIYIEPIGNDRLMVIDLFRNSLTANGFKITQDKTVCNYLITINYDHRSDTGCGGRVIKDLSGQIMDVKNNAEIVATIEFNQNAFEGKCASEIMNALSLKLKEENNKLK